MLCVVSSCSFQVGAEAHAEKLQSIAHKQKRWALSLQQLQQRVQYEAESEVSLKDRMRPTAKF